MKLKLKMIAIAAAMASLAGTAHADLTTGSTVNNGSFSLLVFNTVTRDWYIRDLGFLINSFLPSTITTTAPCLATRRRHRASSLPAPVSLA